MLAGIAEKDIFHSDLQQNNILWDSYKGKFNPVDFGYDPRDFSNKLAPEDLLHAMQYDAEDCANLIKQKIITSYDQAHLFQAMGSRNFI